MQKFQYAAVCIHLEELPIIRSIQTKIFGRENPNAMKLERHSIPNNSKKPNPEPWTLTCAIHGNKPCCSTFFQN